MTPTEIQAVFSAQVENMRELERAWNHINRDMNLAFVNAQDVAVSYETKLLALVYCALSESVLSKLIHTPNGLSPDEIRQVKQALASTGIRDAWKKCVALGIARVYGQKSNHVPNAHQKLDALVEEYIHETSLLRNKIAHGQWVQALNRDHTAINHEITSEIVNLDVVDLYRRKHALETLWKLVEDLIKSPNRAHHRDYWKYVSKFEEQQKKMQTWTVGKKVQSLRHKKKRAPGNV